MKKINLVFGVLLAASLCGNVYLWGAQQEQAGQLAEGNARLEELQQQSADQQAGQAELTAQFDAAQKNLTTAQQDAQTAREALQTAVRPIPEQKPAPATTPPAPVANTQSPAAQNPTEQEVNDFLNDVLNNDGSKDYSDYSANDLLNEAFGGGSSTPSKPSGGSSGGTTYHPGGAGGDGSGLGAGHADPDDFVFK